MNNDSITTHNRDYYKDITVMASAAAADLGCKVHLKGSATIVRRETITTPGAAAGMYKLLKLIMSKHMPTPLAVGVTENTEPPFNYLIIAYFQKLGELTIVFATTEECAGAKTEKLRVDKSDKQRAFIPLSIIDGQHRTPKNPLSRFPKRL